MRSQEGRLQLQSDFLSEARKFGQGLIANKPRISNRAFSAIQRVVRKLRSEQDKGKAFLASHIRDEDPSVRFKALVYLLPLDDVTAKQGLAAFHEDFKLCPDLGIRSIGWEAHDLILEWEAGNLREYLLNPAPAGPHGTKLVQREATS